MKLKFRQRVAWLMVVVFLATTFAFVYYMFEINEHYNTFALDHVQSYHQADYKSGGRSIFSSLWGHVSDVPLAVWVLVLLLPYIQVFMMIVACTKAEPRLSLAYLWPGLLFLKYQRLCHQPRVTVSHMENGHVTNGHSIIET